MTPTDLEALGDEIATFAARIDVAEHALITRLRAFDAHRVHNLSGDSWQQQLGRRRFVRRCETAGGMVRIEMQLPPEEAALVWNAMQSAMDQEPVAGSRGSLGYGAYVSCDAGSCRSSASAGQPP